MAGEERVLIFGATSAIAAEVAVLYARRGARLHLVARNADKLSALAERLRADPGTAHAVVSTERADFAQLADSSALVARALSALGGFDTVLIAHGDLGDQLASERSFDAAEATLLVNFTSVVALLVPLANHLEAARSGRLGVITSVAGERGRPRNYTYGAAKGGLNVYLQGLRSRLYRSNVSVTTLELGPVDTPMTRDHEKHPLFGKPAPVARDIVAALDARESRAIIPRAWRIIMPLVKLVPEPLFQKLSFLSGR